MAKNIDKMLIAEVLCYFILTLGVSFDHISTEIGLSSQIVYETNPLAIMLMENNIWWAFDVALISSFIICCYYMIHLYYPRKYIFLVFPLCAGVVRFCVGLWNISLLL
jgi:hypothetical protein